MKINKIYTKKGCAWLSRQVTSALKFIISQKRKGWTMGEALQQVGGSYGGLIQFYTAKEILKRI